ncbi:MAG: pilus assembly protein, partial [Alphaproteobacteria bacterium]|nr:pilus assembly protein [Alphaproteobacteria bacterium]
MAELFKRIASDRRGSFAIETAFVAPVLILMTLGIAETGTIVARQHELQSVANEAEIIILATNQGATTDVDTIKQIVQESVNLSADDVTLTQLYRCEMDETLVASPALCDSDDIV